MLRCFQRRANIGEIMGKLGIQKKKGISSPPFLPPPPSPPAPSGEMRPCHLCDGEKRRSFQLRFTRNLRTALRMGPGSNEGRAHSKAIQKQISTQFHHKRHRKSIAEVPESFPPPLVTSSQPFHIFFPFPDPNRCFLNPNPG